MNPKTFGGSIWLLLFGTASVLLIAAFARFDSGDQAGAAPPDAAAQPTALAAVPLAGPFPLAAVVPPAAPMIPVNLSPGLAEVIKLAQAHIPDDTILAYIQNSGQTYNPTADEILYLSDLGVSDKVMAALVKAPETPAASAPAAEAPPVAAPATQPQSASEPPPAPLYPPAAGGTMTGAMEDVIEVPDAPPALVEDEPAPLQNPQQSYFYNSLAPYGNWVQAGGGWGWQPTAAALGQGWTPYRDRGHWVMTTDGWYWASDYSWGWAPFHYGRWMIDPQLGWVWVPGNNWAPAWVAWRNTTDGFAGWAPLPPHVRFRPGAGLAVGAGAAGWRVSYGLNAASFTFVAQQHFLSHNVGAYAVPVGASTAIFHNSTPVNNYSFIGGRIHHEGISAGQIAAATKSPVPVHTLSDVSTPSAAGIIHASKDVAVFRPKIAAPAAGSAAAIPAQAPGRQTMVNKPARPSATPAVSAPAATSRPAPLPADFNAPPRPNAPAAPARSGFISSNFQPPSTRTAQASSPSAPPSTGRAAWNGGVATRSVEAPAGPAPTAGYPTYSPRGNGSAAPTATGTAPSFTSPQYGSQASGAPRNVPAYGGNAPAYNTPASAPPRSTPAPAAPPSAPQHTPPAATAPAATAPAASAPASAPQHSAPAATSSGGGGGGQGGQGSGSSSSSSSSSNSSKTTK